MKRLLVALSLCAGAALAQPASVNPPGTLVCLGDSITFGVGSGTNQNPSVGNWCNGADTTVQSHLTRLRALNASATSRNLAVPGAKMRDLAGEVGLINTTPDYVAILMGANDVCTSSEATMSSVAEFRAQFSAALGALSRRFPEARIYVLSIPDVYRLWEVFKDNGAAVTTWESGGGTCQSLLDAAQDLGADASARRGRVRERLIAFNAVLKEVCATYLHCRYDEGAVFAFDFTAEAVSTTDYFHPSRAGQQQLATLSWNAGFDFSDRTPPVSHAEPQADDAGVALVATDDVGPRGVEYFVTGADAGTWLRYETPLPLPSSDTVFYRGVDVNGNTESTRSYNAVTGDDAGVPDAGAGGGGTVIIDPGGDAGPLEPGGCGGCGSGGGTMALLAAGLTGLAVLRRRHAR